MTKPKAEIKRHKQSPVPGGRPNRVRVQLTDEQLQALQQVSQERHCGIPQILIEAHFQPTNTDPRTLMREVAGVRRILSSEAELMRGMAERQMPTEEFWKQIADGMLWRNETLTKRYGW